MEKTSATNNNRFSETLEACDLFGASSSSKVLEMEKSITNFLKTQIKNRINIDKRTIKNREIYTKTTLLLMTPTLALLKRTSEDINQKLVEQLS